jgi:hypothetical protein
LHHAQNRFCQCCLRCCSYPCPCPCLSQPSNVIFRSQLCSNASHMTTHNLFPNSHPELAPALRVASLNLTNHRHDPCPMTTHQKHPSVNGSVQLHTSELNPENHFQPPLVSTSSVPERGTLCHHPLHTHHPSPRIPSSCQRQEQQDLDHVLHQE